MNKKLYEMVLNYTRLMIGNPVANYYDAEDIANDVWERYIRCGYEAIYPITYLHMMVRSQIINQHNKDKTRCYMERQQEKLKYSTETCCVWIDSDEDSWNTEVICDGPEKLWEHREILFYVWGLSKDKKFINQDVLEHLMNGDKRSNAWEKSNGSRKAYYKEMRCWKKELLAENII